MQNILIDEMRCVAEIMKDDLLNIKRSRILTKHEAGMLLYIRDALSSICDMVNFINEPDRTTE